MWSLGWQETMVIFLLALLLFGPKKLPELGKNIAKGLAEFRRASSDLKATFDKEMANIERETGSIKQDLEKHTSEFTNYDSYYENSYYDSSYDAANSGAAAGQNEPSQGNSTVSASATEGAESKTVQASNGQNGAATQAASDTGSTATATADQPPESKPADEKPVARA